MVMFFNKKKSSDKPAPLTEDDIQDEIRKRILKEALKREGKENSEEATKATLDALEEMVTLSRQEMEEIAEQVRKEFKEKSEPVSGSKGRWVFPWFSLGLIALTFMLARRGSHWYLYTAIILAFVCLNYFIRKPPK